MPIGYIIQKSRKLSEKRTCSNKLKVVSSSYITKTLQKPKNIEKNLMARYNNHEKV